MKQHFHREINELHEMMAQLGGMVEQVIGKAITSLYEGDANLAGEVRFDENRIDEMEVAIEERCLNIMALYQPVARDLRFLVTVLKVNNELEHIGDLADSIARHVPDIPKSKVENTRMALRDMAGQTQEMVSLTLDALLNEDSDKARSVVAMDDQIDTFHRNHHKLVAENIESVDREFTVAELKMLSISRSLERIADLATSIAEDVIYCVEAKIVRHDRRLNGH